MLSLRQIKATMNKIMAMLFLIFISIMVILSFMTPIKEFSSSENRRLEQKPKISLSLISNGKFTKNFEKYISDQFPLRDFWIGIKSNVEKFIGKKESNGVFLGKDGYLLQDFKTPNDKVVDKIVKAINTFAKSNKNVNTYFMLVPTSIKIYEDKLPNFVSTENELKYMNIMGEKLDKNISFISTYEILNSKKHEYIYYKTDHHWTTNGAYYGYETLGKHMGFTPLKKDDFNIKDLSNNFLGSLYSKGGFRNLDYDKIQSYIPKNIEDINYEVWYSDTNKTLSSFYDKEKLNEKDKYAVFFDSNHPLVKIKTKVQGDVKGKKLLVIKDSYANCLVPFLTSHYGEIYMVDLRYFDKDLNELIKSEGIEDTLILYNVNTFFEDASITNVM
ncbi:hypothetical protein DP130_12565 [Clostridium tetani]|uniref:DHHW protein n=1 Tax=Clostridium tetani TaxID=1513 RepID=A0A4Q0VAF1_CLOTA|nr:DHHW family protein [Clostridium tetani]RXI45079.1 hypothetical protein DP130_12565 [Clostridium tetani]